jgi:hypothetical protein
MTFDLERFSTPPDSINRRPTASVLPWFTPAGMADRRNEADHVVRMQQIRREAEQLAAEQAKHLVHELAHQQASAQALSEAKYTLHRAHTESRLLAGEDPVLQAHFGIMDDTLAVGMRTRLLHWQ